MGTNYYAIPKLDEKGKKLIIQAIEEEKFGLAKDMIPERVHVGKSSLGWAFCFNHNNWRYFEDVDDMWQWLQRCEIENEYGDPISYEELRAFVESRQDKAEKSRRTDWYENHKGYVFSTSTDFS